MRTDHHRRIEDAAHAVRMVMLAKGDVVGHEFHGNQWTGGEGGVYLDSDHARGVKLVCTDVAKSMGFPAEHVGYSDQLREFEVNGTKYNMAGEAYLKSGDILIYPAAISNVSNAEGIMAHEIGHHQFEAVQKALGDERQAIMRDPDTLDNIRPDGTLRSGVGLEEKYPVYSQLAPVVEVPSAFSNLQKEDGCTQYSKDWWQAYKSGTASYHQAMHEAFAEVSRLAFEAKRDGVSLASKGVKPAWRALYKSYRSVYKTLK